MFTIVFYNHDKETLECRHYNNPETMMEWARKYYEETDWNDSNNSKLPIKVFADCQVPLKCKWTAFLASDDATIKIMDSSKVKSSKKSQRKQEEEAQEDF
jgi:hypothetical protein